MVRRFWLAVLPLLVVLGLTACDAPSAHKTPIPAYKTLPRPALPTGVAAPSCGTAVGQHYMGACLPQAFTLPQSHSSVSGAIHVAGDSGITGPDLSNNDPIYDSASWAAIAARNKFVYLKSVEGTGFYDSTAAAMAAQAKAHGLPVGGYDFLHVCGNSASEEAAFFVRALKAQGLLGPGTLPPAADAEFGTGSCGGQAWLSTWVATVKALTGITPIAYTGAWWWQPNLGSYWPAGVLSWISGYGVSYPYMPSGRSQLDIWQFSDHGWNGATSVDLSKWMGSAAAFAAFAHTLPPGPTPAQIAGWTRGRDFSVGAFQARHCAIGDLSRLTRSDCVTFRERAEFYQGLLNKVQPRPHCFAGWNGKSPVCKVIRPEVARRSAEVNRVRQLLVHYGCRKITFVGGPPTGPYPVESRGPNHDKDFCVRLFAVGTADHSYITANLY